MTLSFPKSHRLLRRSDFKRNRCTRTAGPLLLIDTRPNGLPHPRLGLVVSRKFGNAVQRNRFKRQVREAFRLNQEKIPKGLDLIILPRSAAREATTSQIISELLSSQKIS